jgi:hypothetical protein
MEAAGAAMTQAPVALVPANDGAPVIDKGAEDAVIVPPDPPQSDPGDADPEPQPQTRVDLVDAAEQAGAGRGQPL